MNHSVKEHFIAKDFPTIEETLEWAVEAVRHQSPKRLRYVPTAANKLFCQADFDFRWLPTNLINGARQFECARQAVLEADLVLPVNHFPDPLLQEIYDHYMLEPTRGGAVFGPISYLRFCDPGPHDFPQAPFQSVVSKLADPVWFSRNLESRWRGFHSQPSCVSVRVPVGLSQEEASKYILKEYIRENACSKRGAGARVRQDRTILKYLGATRVLRNLSRSEGFEDSKPLHSRRARRLVWSELVAEAKLLTEAVFGEPLLKSDQEWQKAQHFIALLLSQYQSEIEWLRELFSSYPNF
jgi:hypothetical protein